MTVLPDGHIKRTRVRRCRAARLRGQPSRHRSLAVEPLEHRRLLTALPAGAQPDDTAEYMLGDVLVTVVLLESDGTIQPSTEDWTPNDVALAKERVSEGLRWWEDTLAGMGSRHTLNFQTDFTYADHPVPTGYEPIAGYASEAVHWVGDFLAHVGYSGGPTLQSVVANMRAFNQTQRTAYGTDWAFTIFVANSTQDPNEQFLTDNFLEFSGAFSYPGGLFVVTPSQRPARAVAHEVAHIFYALDEYQGGASYSAHRGYYDTQNLNAATDRPAGASATVQSLMFSDPVLAWAYESPPSAGRISPTAAEMIGWKDTDGDGIFDVLDVPHTLEGSGAYDVTTGHYRFIGSSTVQALTNQNPSGLGNDITLNRIDRVEYRFDSGAWTTLAEFPDRPAAVELDLTIPVPDGAGRIEIRTVDAVSTVESSEWSGPIAGPGTGLLPRGINGFVWADLNENGVREPGEPGLAEWTVRVSGATGDPLGSPPVIEPDDYPAETLINPYLLPAVVSVELPNVSEVLLGAVTSGNASTGTQVFAYDYAGWRSEFKANYNRAIGLESTSRSDEARLKVAFPTPVATLSLDAIGVREGSFGRLEVYDAQDNLLGRFTTQALAAGEFETMTVSRVQKDIAYALAWGHGRTTGQDAASSVLLDNLRFGAESTADTDRLGAYQLPYLDAGTYQVEVLPPADWSNSAGSIAVQTAVLSNGGTLAAVDFGMLPGAGTSFWRNPIRPPDVDASGDITPRDLRLIVDDLQAGGVRELPGLPGVPAAPTVSYLDPNGDGSVSLRDAAIVYAAVLNATPSGGAGGGAAAAAPASAAPSGAAAAGDAPDAEGSAVPASSAEGLPVLMGDDTRWSSRFSVLAAALNSQDTLERELQRPQDTLKRELQQPESLRNHLPEVLSKAYAKPAETRESGAEIISEWDDVFADLAEDVAVAWGKLAQTAS